MVLRHILKQPARLFAVLLLSAFAMPTYAAADGMWLPEVLFYHSDPDTTKTPRFPIPPDTGNPYDENSSAFYLNDPSNITREVVYDIVNKQYTFISKVGDFMYRTPTSMSRDEYFKYQNKKSMREYWKEKRDASMTTTADGNSVIPEIYIGGEAFEMIFGSNTIDIRPQVTAQVDFGFDHSYREDPSLQNKTHNKFVFDQSVQMSVVATIGEKIKFNFNYNTEATFSFENRYSLKYEGKEDEIVQLIEAGDVSLPLGSSLITGSQALFGVKNVMKFGNTTVTSVVSYQNSETENITVTGGALTKDYELSCLDYEENRHFFINQYFRDHYERSLDNLPIVESDININHIEVWVTNTGTSTVNSRNLIAFSDLGEAKAKWIYNSAIAPLSSDEYPSNYANTLYTNLDTTQIRNIGSITPYISGDPLHTGGSGYMVSGQDYEKIEKARKLNSNEYTFNSKLGFISLNTTLASNQCLAVAYQYTVIGSDEVYQVGELSDQGINDPNILVVKLLKGTTVNTQAPMWDLMMKNVYNLRAYQVSRDNFTLNILYSSSGSVPTGYFNEGPEDVKGVALINLMNVDNLNQQDNPIKGGDGLFDFIDGAATMGGTVNASNGRIYFPVLEPFGSHIRNKIFPDNPELADKYAYDSLYRSTKTVAEQNTVKNKFKIEGSYSSASGSEISLNTMNVQQGSVVVTAGGAQLTENVDYTVDYTLGRVKIINEGILNSGSTINIRLEGGNMVSMVKKTLLGSRVEHKIRDNFYIGGTILHLSERAHTTKVNYSNEPISNTIYGFDFNYQTESRWLTNVIDKLPGINTKQVSTLALSGEFAQFMPGISRSTGDGGTSYIDDFEGSKSTTDLRPVGSWFLASTPQKQTDLFPEAELNNNLDYGKNRAKLAWYIIDQSVFYQARSSLRPHNVDKDELSKHSVRQVLESELFPQKEVAAGTPTNIQVLNLAYYPEERGPYNYDVNPTAYSAGVDDQGRLNNPESRWGGIMRAMDMTDFNATNVEYIEFWLMDPFVDDSTMTNKGKLCFNLGDISEDILRDGRKSYEHGMPTTADIVNVDSTAWGYVPTLQALVESFDNNSETRQYQDVGYDGLTDENERVHHATYLELMKEKFGVNSEIYQNAYEDPSNDNYHFFRGTDYDQDPVYGSILERYKKYNNPQGNSPSESQMTESYTTNATRLPNKEDINGDNTLSESERYFQYEIDIDPNKMEVGKNYIADICDARGIKLANGEIGSVRWYQFRIPIRQPDKIMGSINDFSSIRFMRVFMKGFSQNIVLRFASLDLVRGEWRAYNENLQAPGEYLPNDMTNDTKFDVSAVNLNENGRRTPIPYVIPPGIKQEVYTSTNSSIRLDEQSLQLKVENLIDGDARAVYKTTEFDLRRYKYLKMFVHAEALDETDDSEYQNGKQLVAFIRLGADITDNYYEYEVPLKFTPWGTPYTNDLGIWPEENNFDIELEKFVDAKVERNRLLSSASNNVRTDRIYSKPDGKNTIKVIGNPSLSDVNTIMMGVKNPRRADISDLDDDGLAKSAIIWFNELRLTDLNSKGGWAALGRAELGLADLGRVVVAGSHQTAGFGGIESDVTTTPLESSTLTSISTDIDVGRFFGEKAGIKIPLHYDQNVTNISPTYNPLDPDIKLSDALNMLETKEERDSLRNMSNDYTRLRNINFINVHKERTPKKGSEPRKPRIYDIENFNVSYSYSEREQSSTDIERMSQINHNGGLNYTYTTNPKNIQPFKKAKWASKPAFQIVKDINFYYLPKSLTFSTQMSRETTEKQLRGKSSGLIVIKPTYSHDWDWTRNFGLRYDLTKELSFEYSSNTITYVYEPDGRPDKGTSEWNSNRDTIIDELMRFGTKSAFNQTSKLTYNLPINKIPLLNWVNVNASYQGTFRWMASALSMQDRFGNTIQNENTKQLTGNLDLVKFYNKSKYLKNINTPKRGGKAGSKSGKGVSAGRGKLDDKTVDTTSSKTFVNAATFVLNSTLRLAMSVRKISINYSENTGSTLPGFMLEPEYVGMNFANNSPGWLYVLGFNGLDPNDNTYIYDLAAEGRWLSTDSSFNSPYLSQKSDDLKIKVTVEPVPSMNINVSANRTNSTTYQHYYRFDEVQDIYQSFTQARGGSFSITTFSAGTAFTNSDAMFDKFLKTRMSMANRLALEDDNDDDGLIGSLDTIVGAYYPFGYNGSSQSVLLYSFLSTYLGRETGSVELTPFTSLPLPNWTLNYQGLTKIPAVQKVFKNFSLNHSYKSIYAISSWGTNLDFDPSDPSQLDNAQNFLSQYMFGQITLTEQFAPLIGLDMALQNSLGIKLEYKKSRTLTMSFTNNQLTEVEGNEIVVGTSYRISGFGLFVQSITGSGETNKLSNDLTVKADVSFRRDKTTLRSINEAYSQISAGQDKLNLSLTADYTFSRYLGMQLYFTRSMTDPFVATSYKTTNTTAGVSLRFSLSE